MLSQKNKIDELTDCIKFKVDNNQLDEAVDKYTQELANMISAGRKFSALCVFFDIIEGK